MDSTAEKIVKINDVYQSTLSFSFRTLLLTYGGSYKHVVNFEELRITINTSFFVFSEESTCMGRKSHRATMQLSVILIIIGMAVVVKGSGDAPKGLHYVGVGYNLVEGNPEGDVTKGGVDPGLLITRKIFQLTWNTNKKSVDNRFGVPDQVTFAPRSSCVTTNKKEVFSGAKSYQKKLYADVEVSGKREKRVLRFQSKQYHTLIL